VAFGFPSLLKTRQKLAMFLAPFRILPFTTEDALTAAKIRGYLERKGTRIGPYDILIAAQALTRSIPIVTHNTGEFRRVPGLSVEDWTE
jgi:Predicted nucleic acid-binding protein, contains PIN domain